MSVLNKTLKGLEQRQSSDKTPLELEQTVTIAPLSDAGEKLHKWILALLALIAFSLISYVVYKKGIVQQYLSTTQISLKKAPLVEQKSIAIVNKEEIEVAIKQPPIEQQTSQKSTVSEAFDTNASKPVKSEDKTINEQLENIEADLVVKIDESTKATQQIASQPEKSAFTIPAEPSMKEVTQVSAEQKAKEHFQSGKKAFTFGLVSEAIAELQQCIAILVEHIECRSLLAAAYYGRKDTVKASELLEQGLSLRPNSMAWRTLLARIYADNKQYQEVLSVLSQQFESQGDNDFWILKGLAAQQLAQHVEALRSFKKLTLAEPQQGKWWLAMGRSAEYLKQWQNAIQYYTTATQIGNLSPASQRYAVKRLQFIRGVLNAT